MEQCPCCGKYMKFNKTYFCGVLKFFYTCECGHDTRSLTTVTSSPNICLPEAVPYNKDLRERGEK